MRNAALVVRAVRHVDGKGGIRIQPPGGIAREDDLQVPRISAVVQPETELKAVDVKGLLGIAGGKVRPALLIDVDALAVFVVIGDDGSGVPPARHRRPGGNLVVRGKSPGHAAQAEHKPQQKRCE